MGLTRRRYASCDDPLIADALEQLLGPLARELLFDAPPGSLLGRDLASCVAVTAASGPLYLSD